MICQGKWKNYSSHPILTLSGRLVTIVHTSVSTHVLLHVEVRSEHDVDRHVHVLFDNSGKRAYSHTHTGCTMCCTYRTEGT